MRIAPASEQLTQEVRPVSEKKEFEALVRSIRRIAASSRAFSGDFIKSLMDETAKSAEGKRDWSLMGSKAQATPVALVALALLLGQRDAGQLKNIFDLGSKLGDVGYSYTNAMQFGHQADEQRIQQNTTLWNAFEQKMASLAQNMEGLIAEMRRKADSQN